jgi:hypothetical protein
VKEISDRDGKEEGKFSTSPTAEGMLSSKKGIWAALSR